MVLSVGFVAYTAVMVMGTRGQLRAIGTIILQLYVTSTNNIDTILIIKQTICTNFSNWIFLLKLYMFRTVPLSIIRSFSLYTAVVNVIQVC